MQDDDLSFAIPTYRLRQVGEPVEQHDEHFWRNGHSLQIIVFGDSTPTNQEKYFPLHFIIYETPQTSSTGDCQRDFAHAAHWMHLSVGAVCSRALALHKPGSR
jgi:hypothetical protein